jgi:Carbamate kinase
MNMLSVVSIGGNALDEEMKNVKGILPAIKMLHEHGNVVITHGNGPQVGELAEIEHLPLPILTAQTEAEIGYAIKRELKNSLGLESNVFLTDILVSKKDHAFNNPTKPIGRYYDEKEIDALLKGGIIFKRFEKGFRRVVPSPRPVEILNLDALKLLARNGIVIAGGGGGIPFARVNKKLEFVEAVIDKDYTTALIAKELGAREIFILTNVDGAYLNYKKEGEELIQKASVEEMEQYLKEGYFGEGSMKPKVEACIDFVRESEGIAVIGNINKALDVVKLKDCTVITS